MLKALMGYNAPLEMSTNTRQRYKAERKVSGCIQGKGVEFANFVKKYFEKDLKKAFKILYNIYIEKKKKISGKRACYMRSNLR